MARSPVDLGVIPYYGGYTTILHRIMTRSPTTALE